MHKGEFHAGQGKRVALVIGNSDYKKARLLHNPGHDAAALSGLLKDLGFRLTALDSKRDHNCDLGHSQMCRALADFSYEADDAEMAVVYFAGHGIEFDGETYLLPIDADLSHVRRAYFETIKLREVLSAVQHPRYLRLIILDACRDNPFPTPMRGLDERRSVSRGLAFVEPRGNTLVAYAAKHGTTAGDGIPGDNSPYAKALLANLGQPDLEIRLLFGGVRDDVLEATKGSQEPHLYGSLGRQEIYLNPKNRKANNSNALPTPSASGDAPMANNWVDKAEKIWVEFKLAETDDTEIVKGYIAQFESTAPFWTAKAKGRLSEIDQAVRLREAMSWKSAQSVDTIAAYDAFKSEWPLSPFVREADNRLATLKEREAWEQAASADSEDAFSGFLNEYSEGIFATEAKARLMEIREKKQAQEAERRRGEEVRYRAEGRIRVIAGAGVDRDRALWIKPGSGESFRDIEEAWCPEMLVAPSGEFMMGSSDKEIAELTKAYGDYFKDEAPQHKVRIGQPFAIGKFAVTFAEWDYAQADGDWQRITGVAPYKPDDRGWGREARPVINVSWQDAMAYVKWLSAKTGRTYRLPTEAEWEFVCRAGTTSPFWFGNSISSDQANYDGNYTFGGGSKGEYREKTVPVDSFQPNPWGLYQVHGNVWEWCEGAWHGNYNGAPSSGTAWNEGGDQSNRVLRGGSWDYAPRSLRAAYRCWYDPSIRFNYIGFRLSRTL